MSKKGLIIIDIQNDYFPGGKMPLGGAEQAGEKAGQILTKFRNENRPVVHIQHIANRPDATFFIPGTFGVEINNCVKPSDGEKIIVKHVPNAFVGTYLLGYLNSNGISELVFAGMMTHMCMDATVRAARDFGFQCVLIGDACATKSLETGGLTVKAVDVQNSFLAALNYFYATVKTSSQYLDMQ